MPHNLCLTTLSEIPCKILQEDVKLCTNKLDHDSNENNNMNSAMYMTVLINDSLGGKWKLKLLRKQNVKALETEWYFK